MLSHGLTYSFVTIIDERINSKVAFFIIFSIHPFDLRFTFDLNKY